MEDILSKSARMVFFFFIIADFGEMVKFSLSFEFFLACLSTVVSLDFISLFSGLEPREPIDRKWVFHTHGFWPGIWRC